MSLQRWTAPAEICEPRVLLSATANNDTATVVKNTPLAINISANDSGVGFFSVTEHFQTSHGQLEIRPNVTLDVWQEWEYWGFDAYDTFGEFYQDWYYEDPSTLTWYAHYTPDSNYTGEDCFLYVITDSQGNLDEAYVDINVVQSSNQAPTVSLTNKVTTLSEAASVATRQKMADIVITDDSQGTNTLGLTGTNSSLFEIYDGDLYLKSGVTLSHTSAPTLAVTVTVNDPAVGGNPDSTSALSVSVTAAVDAINDTVTIAHNTPQLLNLLANDTGSNLRITSLTQPSHGSVVLRPDVSATVWNAWATVGHILYPTFNGFYEAVYSLSSATLVWKAYYTPANGYSGSDSFTYTISDGASHTDTGTVNLTVQAPANQVPTVALTNKVETLAENTSTASRIKMADIVITDDNQGTNTLALTGTNASLFEIYDGDLYLKSGTTLNYEALTALAVTVTVNDTTVGGTPDDSKSLSVAITNLNDVAPTLALTSPRTTPLPEDTFFAVRYKVATVVITDDGLGTNTLSLTGADASLFEVDHTGLYIKAGASLNYASNPQLDVTVQVDDTTHGSGVDDTENYSLAVADANLPPRLSFDNVVTSLDEDTDTTGRLFIADLVVEDDATAGPIEFTLSGTDAELFEIVDDQLFLKAGTELDFEAVSALRVAVGANDTSMGAGIEDSARLKLLVNNVNDVAPELALANPFTASLSEDAAIPPRFQVAEIRITDDGAGANTLTLSGADAALFEIDGNRLLLKSDAVLDFETNPVLDVTVNVNDAEFGTGVDDSATYSLTITDANDAPVVSLDDVVDELPEDTDFTTALRVADVVIADDAESDPVITLSGADQELFEVVDGELRLKAGTVLDHETRPQLSVTVMVYDLNAAGPNSTATLTIDVTNINDVGPRVSLENIRVTPLPENQAITTRLKVADIVIQDDGLGTNDLTLTGENVSLFEIYDGDLYLKAGTELDHETISHLSVTVNVADAALPGSVSTPARYLVSVADVNEAPELSLDNAVTSLPENTSTTERVYLADLVADDDSLGFNEFSLSGTDAAEFEIIGRRLFLKAGTDLDHETQPSYSVTVSVDDAALAGGAEDSLNYTLTITNVTLAAVNDAIRVENTFRDEAVLLSPLANEFFDGTGTLRILSVTGAQHGTVSIVDNSGSSAHDQISYTPDGTFTGTETLTYVVEDGDENQSTATITLTVVAAANANRAPLAPEMRLSTPAEADLQFTLLPHVLDADGDELTLVSFAAPQHGDITSVTDSNGVTTYTYTPDDGFTGTETLSYTVEDEYGALVTSAVIIAVGNTRAVAVADRYQVEANTTLTASSTSRASKLRSVLVNDMDVEGQTLTASLVGDVQHGTLVLNSNGTFTYTPDEDYVGSDSFTYKANDGFQESVVQTVTIEVFQEDLGTGVLNGIIPQEIPDPHDVENESNTNLPILIGAGTLDPTRPFQPPANSGNTSTTSVVDDTVESTDEDDVEHSSDREITISRASDANVYQDGSWTYWETYSASYTIVTTSSDGSLVTETGTYTYLVTASGDESFSTYTLTAHNASSSSGSYTTSWSENGQTGSVDYDWLQNSTSDLSVVNYTNVDTGVAWGSKNETQTQWQSYIGSGTYSYGINGGTVTGVINSSGAQSGGTTLSSLYSGGPVGWNLSGSGSSWSIGNDNSTRSGGGDYLVTSNADGVSSTTNGSLTESGYDNSVNSLGSQFVLDSAGWHMTSGNGLTTSFGGTSRSSTYNGDYAHSIEGGQVNGTLNGWTRDGSSYSSQIVAVGLNDLWTNSGTASQSESGETGNLSSGTGSYLIANQSIDSVSLNTAGTVNEQTSDNSHYTNAAGYTLAGEDWVLTSGTGTSHGEGSSFSEFVEPPAATHNYSREIRNEDDELEGTIQGKIQSRSGNEASYVWDISSAAVNGEWVETGTATNMETDSRDRTWGGTGTYDRLRTLDDGTQVHFVGTLSEYGSEHDQTTFTVHSALIAGEWVQTDGSGASSGNGNSYFGQNSQDQSGPTANDTYSRLISGGSVHGTASELFTEESDYDYLVTSEFDGADWIESGTRNDHVTWSNIATYESNVNAMDGVRNDYNDPADLDDSFDSLINTDVVEHGSQNEHGESRTVSILDTLGEWELFSGWDQSQGNGTFHSQSAGTGISDQVVPGGVLHSANLLIIASSTSTFLYDLRLEYESPAQSDPQAPPLAKEWVAKDNNRHDTENTWYEFHSQADPQTQDPASGLIQTTGALAGGPSALVSGDATQTRNESAWTSREFDSKWNAGLEHWELYSGFGSGGGSGESHYAVDLTGVAEGFELPGGAADVQISIHDEQISSFNYSLEFLLVNDPADQTASPRQVWQTTGARTEDFTYILNKTALGDGQYSIAAPEDEEVTTYLTETGSVNLDIVQNLTIESHVRLVMDHLALTVETPPPEWADSTGEVTRRENGRHLTTYTHELEDPASLVADGQAYSQTALTRHILSGIRNYDATAVIRSEEGVFGNPQGHGTTDEVFESSLDLSASLAKTIQRDGFTLPGLSQYTSHQTFSNAQTIGTGFDQTGAFTETSRKITQLAESSMEERFEAQDVAYSRPVTDFEGTIAGTVSVISRNTTSDRFAYNFESLAGQVLTESGSRDLTIDSQDDLDYASLDSSGAYQRLMFTNPQSGQQYFISGRAAEWGTIHSDTRTELHFELDPVAGLWRVLTDNGQSYRNSHGSAQHHFESSALGSYSSSHTTQVAGDQAGIFTPDWIERNGGPDSYDLDEIELDVVPNDVTFILQTAGGTSTLAHTYAGSVSESRSRDWGYDYDLTGALVWDEVADEPRWVNSGTGHTFLRGSADYDATHTGGVSVSFALPSGAVSGGAALTGYASSSLLETTTVDWHKDYDQRVDYILAQDDVAGVTAWVQTAFHDERHSTASVSLDHVYQRAWLYTSSNVAQDGWTDYRGDASYALEESSSSWLDVDRLTTYVPGQTTGTTTGARAWGRTGTGSLSREEHSERWIVELFEFEPGYPDSNHWYDESTTNTHDGYAYEWNSTQALPGSTVNTTTSASAQGNGFWQVIAGLGVGDWENPDYGQTQDSETFSYNLPNALSANLGFLPTQGFLIQTTNVEGWNPNTTSFENLPTAGQLPQPGTWQPGTLQEPPQTPYTQPVEGDEPSWAGEELQFVGFADDFWSTIGADLKSLLTKNQWQVHHDLQQALRDFYRGIGQNIDVKNYLHALPVQVYDEVQRIQGDFWQSWKQRLGMSGTPKVTEIVAEAKKAGKLEEVLGGVTKLNQEIKDNYGKYMLKAGAEVSDLNDLLKTASLPGAKVNKVQDLFTDAWRRSFDMEANATRTRIHGRLGIGVMIGGIAIMGLLWSNRNAMGALRDANDQPNFVNFTGHYFAIQQQQAQGVAITNDQYAQMFHEMKLWLKTVDPDDTWLTKLMYWIQLETGGWEG